MTNIDQEKNYDKYNEKVREDLISTIERINEGFAFYGINVEIDSENHYKLNFFDKDGKLICSQDYSMPKYTGLYFTEFDHQGFTYSFVYDTSNDQHRFIFLKSCNEYGLRVELEYDDFDEIIGMKVVTNCKDEEFVWKTFNIEDDSIRVELNNHFGEFGNYVDGKLRSLWITKKTNRTYPVLFMTEEFWPGIDDSNFRQIAYNEDFTMDTRTGLITPEFSYDDFEEKALNLARHPRNVETINYALDDIDKKFNGIKDYVIKNFEIYHDIMDKPYEYDSDVSKLIDDTLLDECNLDNTEDRARN